uniref:Transcription regulator AsnC/Lrp ligand binding domain-containing protein n=1 Tax=mine drainage metagenome TaxID=410659 RepID=E6QL78_9ZZZZ
MSRLRQSRRRLRYFCCHRITGDESFVPEAHVVTIQHLEALIDKLSAFGATSTSTILSSPVEQ